jgi:hypothetical protein
MALGIVLVCSDYGFNREIVNSDRLILFEFNSKSYSDLIIKICKQPLWTDFSKDMQALVANKFTSLVVQAKLLPIYTKNEV